VVSAKDPDGRILGFLDRSRYFCNLYTYINTISKLCVEKPGRVEECSVAPLCDKRVKTLCGSSSSVVFMRLS
jgi:hypothetical protein